MVKLPWHEATHSSQGMTVTYMSRYQAERCAVHLLVSFLQALYQCNTFPWLKLGRVAAKPIGIAAAPHTCASGANGRKPHYMRENTLKQERRPHATSASLSDTAKTSIAGIITTTTVIPWDRPAL